MHNWSQFENGFSHENFCSIHSTKDGWTRIFLAGWVLFGFFWGGLFASWLVGLGFSLLGFQLGDWHLPLKNSIFFMISHFSFSCFSHKLLRQEKVTPKPFSAWTTKNNPSLFSKNWIFEMLLFRELFPFPGKLHQDTETGEFLFHESSGTLRNF